MATNMSKTQKLHQSHMTLVLNNKPSWSNKHKIKKNIQEHEIKHNTSTPYKPIKLHKQTNQLEHPVQQKQNTTHWTRIIKNNDKPDYSSWKQITTHTRQYRIPSLQTSLTNGIPSPTFLIREVLTVSKKKTPSGVNQESITTGKEREKGKKSGSWGSKNKLLQYLPNLRVDKDTTNFFLSQNFFLSLPFEHDGRQFNFGFSTHDQNDIRHRSNYPG